MEHKHRYLQQGTIKPVAQWDKNKTILMNINLEYMGSAEFEFGALPKAMARLIRYRDNMVFGKVLTSLPKDPLRPNKGFEEVLVRYWVHKDREEDLLALLKDWDSRKRHFKEWNVHLNKGRDIVFCIDKGYECFMWNGKLGKRLIESQLKVTEDILLENGWFD